MRILLAGGGTGGHLMPALALAQALAAARADVEPVLVGAERGIEAQLLPRYPFRYALLPIEPIYRSRWWKNLRWPLIAGQVWRSVGRVLDAERPALVIGTGGYAAGPVVWRAARRGIPTVLQEQNAFPGLTTRWLARRARQVHLGFPEARERLRPGRGTEVFALGNPIRPPAPGDRAAAARQLGLVAERPTLLVFGGSQGARAINYAMAGALTEVYGAADLVVARAGAITVAELCAWGKAGILVPLPTAAGDHQSYNARALAEAGAAVHLPERDLSPYTLAGHVTGLLADPPRLESLAARARDRGHPNAVRDIVSRILTLLV